MEREAKGGRGKETVYQRVGGETPQRQWGSFDSRANWNAADANDDGTPGLGYPPGRGAGAPGGSWKCRCNPGIGGAYIPRAGGVARDIEAYHLVALFSPSLLPLAANFSHVVISSREIILRAMLTSIRPDRTAPIFAPLFRFFSSFAFFLSSKFYLSGLSSSRFPRDTCVFFNRRMRKSELLGLLSYGVEKFVTDLESRSFSGQ